MPSSEKCSVCDLSFEECKGKCKVCALPLHIRKDIDVEFLERGSSTQAVKKWVEDEYGLNISHVELFECIQHNRLTFEVPAASFRDFDE